MTARILLLLNGLAFAGTALFAFFAPDKLCSTVGFTVANSVGHNELLANYGGMYLGLGAYLLLAAWRVSLRRDALLVLTVVGSGLALGRVVSATLHGAPSETQLVFLAWEATTACLGAVLLARQGRPQL